MARFPTPEPLVGLPAGKRLDLVLEVLAGIPKPPGGWSVQDIAELAGCSRWAVRKRQNAVIDKLRNEFKKRGVFSTSK